MIATIEDGFFAVKSVQTSRGKSKEDIAEADIGTSNLFALLSVGLKGNHKTSVDSDETTNEEKTHTTVSLFQRLKSQLEDNKLIIRDADKARIGDFVEIQGLFKTNPVIDMLSGIKELMVLANLFADNKKENPNQSKKDRLLSNNRFYAQIDGLIDGLQSGGKKDIICETESMKIIIPTDENYFLNGNMYEVTDGNYKVLGKVVAICKESGEISLLRNTVFSRLQLDKMKEFQEIFKDPAFEPFVGEGGIKTSIEAPVLMLIPIAIYI